MNISNPHVKLSNENLWGETVRAFPSCPSVIFFRFSKYFPSVCFSNAFSLTKRFLGTTINSRVGDAFPGGLKKKNKIFKVKLKEEKKFALLITSWVKYLGVFVVSLFGWLNLLTRVNEWLTYFVRVNLKILQCVQERIKGQTSVWESGKQNYEEIKNPVKVFLFAYQSNQTLLTFESTEQEVEEKKVIERRRFRVCCDANIGYVAPLLSCRIDKVIYRCP